ncbi:hypothetical protein NQ318_018949 [Aromia moschata]|uniref:Uncharacterized protein n=1 Tax=Aromia moschata TaxID=1265417 RepID=A0AAV8ZGC9_9CUCU|nr:hypothetical protein NQ318_018949 [Aromia moschata]
MPPKGKLAKWITDNIVLLVGIPLIIGVHYGWSKLQDIPYLVEPSEKKEFPLIGAYHSYKNKFLGNESITASSSTSEPQEK